MVGDGAYKSSLIFCTKLGTPSTSRQRVWKSPTDTPYPQCGCLPPRYLVWMVWNMGENKNNKELTATEEVTLYSLSTYMINAATLAQKTSLVEFMASGEQNPDFFVSQ